ncbi:MAG: S41 family peptidase [Lentimicrobiaceae bacterium]|jgi:carboxyl-terminal processing protease|nr:S41 family peptidase [Lentimicrobiaceae bacterium]MCP4909248.1 S41 family peptidase [Bacteroidota bacterium]MBT3454210.1 S41 family peptidase [Lentimicrobiaceae bacterium]MBT3819235.1 S41 family peptidase [Lentimicrobiaceae bacterium]MBT4060370.1 S41 family peptidase [Lentimicrobiaceae bacterium]
MIARLYKILLTFIIVITFINGGLSQNNNFELSKNLEIYADILRQLNLNYADDINPGELNTAAIDALLKKLDPYTVYVPESRREDFELMTKGEYGGIGSMIQKQGDYVIISEPYEGFPAQKTGLRPGDKIIAINGESAFKKSSNEISDKLKGTPGTEIIISVMHYGDTTVEDFAVVREKIKIPNIPYYGMLNNSIGYINLLQFNPQSANEVKKAFNKLSSENTLEGLVLDLRGNGGGLLNEAVDIVNIFVPKNRTIVTTKGKVKSNTTVHRTKNNAINTKIPLVVLVNGNSASASEIVAGALQDMDRGVVIGEKTFGKGLVQNILELPYNSKMKLTVAKYYIPSGRCIQAIDYFKEAKQDSLNSIPDSLLNVFKTSGGRMVYDKGGIEPDITIEVDPFSQISGDLYAQNYIFNFANEFVLENDSISYPDKFVISDEVFEDFKNYARSQGFDYRTETEIMLDRLMQSADREDYKDALNNSLDTLALILSEEKKKDIDKNKKEIEEMLKLEIITRYYYQSGRLQSSLINDPEIEEAIRVLTNKDVYSAILSGTYKY